MENLGVKAGDSRDSLGRGRFFPSIPEEMIFPVQKWDWYYPAEEGMACCSDSAVSFHYVPPNQMYVMEYLLYHLRPYGIHSMVHSNGPDKASSTTTTPSFIGVPLKLPKGLNLQHTSNNSNNLGANSSPITATRTTTNYE